MDDNNLTPDEARFLLDLLRTVRTGVNFELDNPEKAIQAAQFYKSIAAKLMSKAKANDV